MRAARSLQRLILTASLLPALACVAQQTTNLQQPSQTPAVQTPTVQTPTIQLPTIQASARAVLLDVVVTDSKGHPVTGLKASDFHLEEDGQPQTIASFEEHHPGTVIATAPTPALPPNTFSNAHAAAPASDASVVILLDALDTPVPAQQYVREQMIAYLKTMHAGVPVAIFQLDTQLHLLQGFTTDAATLLHSVTSRDAPRFTAIPQRGGYVAENVRMDILTRGMQSLSQYLQAFPGRKNLAWFTARVPDTLYDSGLGSGSLRDPEAFTFDYAKLEDTLRLGRVSIYPIDSRGLQSGPGFQASSQRGPSQRSNEAFDFQQVYEHGDLDDIANSTGGRAFYNSNGITQALASIVDTAGSFYTLSYSPLNKSWEGEYRKLKLTTTQPGARLSYRPGYYALRNAPRHPNTAPRVQLTHHQGAANAAMAQSMAHFHDAMGLGAVDPGGVIFQATVGTDGQVKQLRKGDTPPHGFGLEPKLADKPYRDYTVHFLIDGRQLQLTAQPDGDHAGAVEFVVLVYDDTGTLAGSGSAQVNMRLKPATYDQLLTAGMAMPVAVQVPVKGQYFLRMGVHDQAGGRGGALQVPVGDLRATAAP